MKNLELKKEIIDHIKFADEYKIYIWVWCEYSNNTYNTWGEIAVEVDDDFVEFYSIDTIDYNKSIDDLTKDEVKNIKKELKKKFTYLDKHLENIVLENEFQWV